MAVLSDRSFVIGFSLRRLLLGIEGRIQSGLSIE